MRKGLLHIVISSVLFYRKAVIIQISVIAILAAVITGSLLTGFSVRKSLKTTAFARMGNTSIVISSGLRYFDAGLSQRIAKNSGQRTTWLLETEGFCQNFSEGIPSGKVKIYGIGPEFFSFHGNDSIIIKKGEVAINSKLAGQIKIKKGDEIIIRLKEISDIPADAPFSTSKGDGISIVMKVGQVLDGQNTGDFSLGISQIVPANIFINLDDIKSFTGNRPGVNRILAENNRDETIPFFTSVLTGTLKLSDLGLVFRRSEMTGHNELISNRIFIDQLIIDEIKKSIPETAPVITYLSNSIANKNRETPYSFVSAIPSSLYGGIAGDDGIAINRWLASDLDVSVGDTINMSWFAPDSINQLREKSRFFPVMLIVEMDSVWGDMKLMPEFPGIAGTESCSEWDAGVPVNMDKIREKDEDYWTKFKGTPKAFISYESGKELWGNNYGPATALRFPAGLTPEQIEDDLKGKIDPGKSGFFITDLRKEALSAANESVDFGTLFISLGFFIIFSSVLLLSLSVSSYFDTKKEQISTLHALGFNKRSINKILFLETSIIAVDGSFTGAVLGLLVNNFIIAALNSVWRGAVQTDTLSASAGLIPLLTGFISSLVIILFFFRIKTRNFLRSLDKKKAGIFKLPSLKINLTLLLLSATVTAVSFVTSILMIDNSTEASFAAGIFLFLTLVLLLRHYYLGGLRFRIKKSRSFQELTRQYYQNNPLNAVTPAIFIAAGIFALLITSLNRVNFDKGADDPSGGTGGYLFWSETSVPVNEDLSTPGGKGAFGLNEEQFNEMELVQLTRKEGDDASCLNLNHIASPPLLGVDPDIFKDKGSFSFASLIKGFNGKNPWEMLHSSRDRNTIYGIADQTVLDWGLKIKTGDTIILRAESGQPVNIIIAAGLKSSVFQGNILIGAEHLKKFFPSVSGSSVFLVDGDPGLAGIYKSGLEERFINHGMVVEPAPARLASFYQVTNTYLSVFTVLGAFGMVLGVFGLGFILLRNYNIRKREFALLSATGFSTGKIRATLLTDLIITVVAGIIIGSASALVATLPSIQASNGIPSGILLLMIIPVLFTGIIILLISVRKVKNESLIQSLRKE